MTMITDPSAAKVAADFEESAFVSGVEAGHWRILEFEFPRLDFVISATKPGGDACEFGFRADLANYPAQSPMVKIWDFECKTTLDPSKRPIDQAQQPKWGQRATTTFQKWGEDTIYRPWDRMTGPHNNNAALAPHLAWTPERRLAFIFEDLHGILNSSNRT